MERGLKGSGLSLSGQERSGGVDQPEARADQRGKGGW